ncbi:MAG TPA: hypothetical protein VN942_00070 [Chthoniobacterales bacterium]|nr:hypothetical protein [Chthoniobacterales bacterium]
MAKPDPRSAAKNSQRIWLFGLALIVATALAYLPAWTGKPIWDDNAHITQPELRSWHGGQIDSPAVPKLASIIFLIERSRD